MCLPLITMDLLRNVGRWSDNLVPWKVERSVLCMGERERKRRLLIGCVWKGEVTGSFVDTIAVERAVMTVGEHWHVWRGIDPARQANKREAMN